MELYFLFASLVCASCSDLGILWAQRGAQTEAQTGAGRGLSCLKRCGMILQEVGSCYDNALDAE